MEKKFATGFKNINKLLENHLAAHEKKDRFKERIIIVLIGIAGSAVISIMILLLQS